MRTPARSQLALWLLAAALLACREEPLTQIVVVIDSDWDGFERAELEITGFEQEDIRIEADDLRDGKPFPRRVGIVHDGGPLGPIGVTVSAYGDGSDEPLRVEPRHGIFFERGQTRLLRIDLFYNCIGICPDQACLRGRRCVDSDDDAATELTPWDGKPGALQVIYKVANGDVPGSQPQAGESGDGGEGGDGGGNVEPLPDGAPPRSGKGGSDEPPQAGSGTSGTGEEKDASILIDSGPPVAMPIYPYKPTNFDPTAPEIADLERSDILLDCGDSEFDSSALTFTNFCGGEPKAVVIQQSDGSDAAVLVMDTLLVREGSTLHLRGARPVIFAVFGDAQVAGTIDASATGANPGPGADRSCDTGAGGAGGDDANGDTAGGGGGGGGFGSSGAAGGTGRSGLSATAAAGIAGNVNGEATLSPLRGGCSGGGGGVGPRSGSEGGIAGAGGGALQLSAAGGVQIFGRLVAGGGGGQVGPVAQDGGGGGGSGGAILLEGFEFIVDSNAEVSANGGAGGAGQPAGFSDPDSTPGADALSGFEAALGGTASGAGGDGGAGAARDTPADRGSNGDLAFNTGAAGGGGGGGLGRIRINRAETCSMRGKFSPGASIDCPSCGACAMPPPAGCDVETEASSTYFFCSDALAFSAALAFCESHNAHLVKVTDEAENDFLTNLLIVETWIGASDSSVEGTWQWVYGSVTFWSGGLAGSSVGGMYESWSTGEPNNGPATGSDCAIITDAGLWLDRACIDEYPFVCETEL